MRIESNLLSCFLVAALLGGAGCTERQQTPPIAGDSTAISIAAESSAPATGIKGPGPLAWQDRYEPDREAPARTRVVGEVASVSGVVRVAAQVRYGLPEVALYATEHASRLQWSTAPWTEELRPWVDSARSVIRKRPVAQRGEVISYRLPPAMSLYTTADLTTHVEVEEGDDVTFLVTVGRIGSAAGATLTIGPAMMQQLVDLVGAAADIADSMAVRHRAVKYRPMGPSPSGRVH